MDPVEPRRKGRETIVTMSLVIVWGGLIVFFLNIISLGILANVVSAILIFGLIGFLHYALWGHTLTEETAGEREEEEMRARLEADKEPWERTD